MASAELTYCVSVHDDSSDNENVGEYLEILFKAFEAINELSNFGLETITSSRVTYGGGTQIEVEERPPIAVHKINAVEAPKDPTD